MSKTIVVAAAILGGFSMAMGQTVVLQQGVNSYAGCTSRLIEGTGPVKDAKNDVFTLRGSKYALHVKFDLPADLAGKKLARARLAVFLPKVDKPNFFTEIFCHEVVTPGRQPAWDELTDYANGRRPGAVDSVELFAPPHEGWPEFPFLELGVPEGGRWIEFNITPVAEKWLKGGLVANNGVILIPTDPPDRAKTSTWEIDIPQATFKKAEQRPKLTLEFAPVEQELLVGVTDSLTRICDRSTRYAYRGGYTKEAKLSMAANEFEGFQVVVYPMLEDANGLRIQWADLAGPEGKKIPAADMECFKEDVYQLRRNWMTSSLMFAGKLYDVPDPLRTVWNTPAAIGTRTTRTTETGKVFSDHSNSSYGVLAVWANVYSTKVRRQVDTPFYFRVRTRPDTAPGVYNGTIMLTADKAKPVTVNVEVTVWPFAIPEKWNFHTMGQFIWGNCGKWHGEAWTGTAGAVAGAYQTPASKSATSNSELRTPNSLQRQYYDFLLDHRFTPTEQYGKILSPRQDMDYCLQRGANTIYLNGNFTGTDAEIAELKDRVAAVRKVKGLDYALVYIGDETNKWDEMHRQANLVHAHVPGALVMIGGSFPREELMGYIDIYDPDIGGGSKTFSLDESKIGLIKESQNRGEEFYWYVAAGPSYPQPNVQVEFPLIDCRTIFWMTWKYGVTGFEYYCYNIWEQNFQVDAAKRWPAGPWLADGWSKGWPSNGDGMIFYPGPTTSLRFESIRDGIEDWEMMQVLSDCVAAVKGRKHQDKYAGFIAQANELLKVREKIVKGFKEFTRDPNTLMAERQAVGNLLAKMVPLANTLEEYDGGQMSLEKATAVRIGRQTTLRRNMLFDRHVKACEALKVQPMTREAFNELWPKRVLFSEDFEKGLGKHGGLLETKNVPPGSKTALAGDPKNKYFARFGSVQIHTDNARAANQTFLKFKYFTSKDGPITIMVFDMTLGDNFVGSMAKPEVGKWSEATLKVSDFKKKGGSGKLAGGNAMDDIFFGGGKPGDAEYQLIVDDVQLIGLD